MSRFDCKGDMHLIHPRKLDLKFSTERHLYLDDQSTVTIYEKGFFIIYITVGITGRTSRAPISAHRLNVDKAQELRLIPVLYYSK